MTDSCSAASAQRSCSAALVTDPGGGARSNAARGSAFGVKPSPSIKLATNTPMYQRLEEDMDLNCGEILDKGVSVAEMGERIFQLFLAVASGEQSKSEELGLGDNEFVPWVIGAVM